VVLENVWSAKLEKHDQIVRNFPEMGYRVRIVIYNESSRVNLCNDLKVTRLFVLNVGKVLNYINVVVCNI